MEHPYSHQLFVKKTPNWLLLFNIIPESGEVILRLLLNYNHAEHEDESWG